jgi:6-pyruvoyltetrahydropterin/6-carboxytetrahydropterin synthase
MHKLARRVRFSVNPFLSEDGEGANSFASRPAGEGLAVFLELSVELAGEVEPATGFVVNVTDIDDEVRRSVVPIFAERIRADFRGGRHIGIPAISELLMAGWEALANVGWGLPHRTGGLKPTLHRLGLKLNPYRETAIDSQGPKMIYFSEKFEFAATHKLWNEDFSEQRNFEVFGKCANPTGHGHNYIVDVTVKAPAGREICVGDFERIVDDELIKVVDHKNLNLDVAHFATTNPTVENIAAFAWSRLVGKFGPDGGASPTLHCVTIWETDKTSCSYYG